MAKYNSLYSHFRDNNIVDNRFYLCKLNYHIVYEMSFGDFYEKYGYAKYVLCLDIFNESKYFYKKKMIVTYFYFDSFIVKVVQRIYSRKVFDHESSLSI